METVNDILCIANGDRKNFRRYLRDTVSAQRKLTVFQPFDISARWCTTSGKAPSTLGCCRFRDSWFVPIWRVLLPKNIQGYRAIENENCGAFTISLRKIFRMNQLSKSRNTGATVFTSVTWLFSGRRVGGFEKMVRTENSGQYKNYQTYITKVAWRKGLQNKSNAWNTIRMRQKGATVLTWWFYTTTSLNDHRPWKNWYIALSKLIFKNKILVT